MKYKNSILYGFLSGLAIIALHLAFFYGKKDILVQGYFPYTIYLVQIPFMIAVGLKYRMANEDLIDFKDALREVVVTFLVGMLMYFACYYILFNADVELTAMLKEKAHENILWLEEQGLYQRDEIKNMLESWEQNDYKVGLKHILQWLPFRTIGGFILSVLVALIVKR